VLTRNTARISAAFAFALLCLSLPRAAHAIGETTGVVAGYVYDPTGAALSEVPLSLSGPMLQETLNATSGDDGRFIFSNVPVGSDFVLTVEVPGFAAVKQTGITVVLGLTTLTDVHLEVASETQVSGTGTIQVVEKVNPVLNPDSAQAVAVIDAEKAAETPFFHQVEGVAQQVAGVGPGTNPVSRGGLARYGKFYVDGLDTTDITNGSITAPMNFDSVQNFEIITGATDAQYNALGVITNAVTKTGSNRFTYDINVTIEPAQLAAQNSYPAQSQDFFGLFVNPTAQPPQTSFYSPVVNLGGPLVKDKLWFYVSYQQNFSHKDSPITQLGGQYNRPTDTTTTLGRFKLTWQATNNDKVSIGVNLDRNVINNEIGTASVTNDAEQKEHRGGEFFLINYDHSFSDSTLFQLQTGFTYKGDDIDPIHSDYTTPNHYDIDTGIDSQNSDAINFTTETGNFMHETKWDLQFNPTLSWNAHGLGTHQLKTGVQVAYQIDDQVTGVSGNMRYTDRGGVCDPNNPSTFSYCYKQTVFYNDQNQEAPLETTAEALNLGAFIQDKWTVNRRLTLLPGIRADMGLLYGDNHAFIGTLAGLGPRFGFTYDLMGDRKTLIVGHYGRSNDVGNVFIAQHVNPSLLQATGSFNTSSGTFENCPAVPNGDPYCSYTGGVGGHNFIGHSSAVFSNLSKTPYVDEVSAGIHSQLIEETVFGLDYTYRYYGDMWADQEVNRIWDPTGTKIIGYVNGKQETVINSVATDLAYRVYHGADLWVQGTPGRWDLLLSYTLAFNNGTVDDYFDGFLNNPRMTQFYYGPLQADRRHTIKGSVAYKTPIGLDFGLRIEYRTGTPGWEHETNPADSSESVYLSPRGTGYPINYITGQPNFNDPNTLANLRNPDEALFHVQARYNVGEALHLKSRLEITLLVVNALNNTNAYQNYDSYGAKSNKFGLAQYRESPLQAEFILRWRN